ncbi:PREDICTED: unnamed product [Prunus dulcis]|uniref:PREDICTED: unnamed product n=1 Tax=Prunus dulcis TaxID=3755 RepID=A0A5E4GNU1_PRUDU|nr:uncharacterized protein LOC117613574 [Prunus dulcis]XP_034213496.1 uncharacterized protein LOC117625994 [Prunus dulcis]VVA16638.1 PREDICTED: unnamed product [Prunus dulcis]VVA41577.1 PREDICTED: unnamed product [Prunus dulcis]
MEPIGDDQVEQSSSRKENNVEEANHLLEECWFFDNLLNRKQKMLRCYSDPQCNSSNFGQEMSVKSSHDQKSLLTTSKATQGNGFAGPNLVRTPSLPLHIGRRQEEEVQVKQSGSNKSSSKLTRQTSHQKMLQTPTKSPACIGRTEGVQDKESDNRRSKMNRQPVRQNLLRTPSLPPCIGREESNQESLPQRHKGLMTQTSSIPRYRPPKNTEGESNASTDGCKEMRRRSLNQLTTRKSLSDLEIEELQGFKDLGFTFDKKELSPSVVNILPGLQEKKRTEDLNPEKVRRPYLSEAWLMQSCAPPPPNLGASRSTEDMKAQIKFWARAVASNVR